ncbi:uncharacterized protein LOC122527964 [Frieseomelitta varia]|uniref:uncharacterized protein LOC122527964 n=1 Tax=Frieseomelitta varia TaxID=561572 RepID=UPI001CB6AFFA|nr:uncharacterized protein LOC122527964 [Frieseomelitta varia]
MAYRGTSMEGAKRIRAGFQCFYRCTLHPTRGVGRGNGEKRRERRKEEGVEKKTMERKATQPDRGSKSGAYAAETRGVSQRATCFSSSLVLISKCTRPDGTSMEEVKKKNEKEDGRKQKRRNCAVCDMFEMGAVFSRHAATRFHATSFPTARFL